MATCKRCNRALLEEHVAEFGPLCPECKAIVEAEKPKWREPAVRPEKAEKAEKGK